MRYYVSVIQKLRKELGLPPASFPHIVTDEDLTKVQQQKESENDNDHKELSGVYRSFTEEPQ